MGCKNIGIRKSEVLAKTFMLEILFFASNLVCIKQIDILAAGSIKSPLMIDIFQQIGIFPEIRSSHKIHKFLTISTYFFLEVLTFQVLGF